MVLGRLRIGYASKGFADLHRPGGDLGFLGLGIWGIESHLGFAGFLGS